MNFNGPLSAHEGKFGKLNGGVTGSGAAAQGYSILYEPRRIQELAPWGVGRATAGVVVATWFSGHVAANTAGASIGGALDSVAGNGVICGGGGSSDQKGGVVLGFGVVFENGEEKLALWSGGCCGGGAVEVEEEDGVEKNEMAFTARGHDYSLGPLILSSRSAANL
ncbi:hypothetical protein Nepgr_031112 [Nepenthes gracilis]|uniref:Uncharacterized protein n=1 Tax=Nepenthes gracilis TaxID=150966 RepID=A0AAD3THP0_NEPGR|nr:hypothetical protein Nepgr_031112 [Nepenthes gracilis]